MARDQQIVQLSESLKQLKQSTDANTAATQATLNPLYSGRGALAIGYYKVLPWTILSPFDQGPFDQELKNIDRPISLRNKACGRSLYFSPQRAPSFIGTGCTPPPDVGSDLRGLRGGIIATTTRMFRNTQMASKVRGVGTMEIL